MSKQHGLYKFVTCDTKSLFGNQPLTYVNSLLMNYLICKQLRNIVYMGVLNTALYYTKVCLGFLFKHTQVDIPNFFNIPF